MEDTMRDLLSKLDRILDETTLQDLKRHPLAKDPEIADAISDQEEKEGGVEEANFPGASDVKMPSKQKPAQARYSQYHRDLKKLADSGAINTPKGKAQASAIIDAIQQLVNTELPGNPVPSKKIWLEGQDDSDQELYGLRIGDTVRVEIEGREEQGDIIDIHPETMEVELLLRGPEAGRTVTVDVRDVEYFENYVPGGDYPDGSSVKTPSVEDWKQQYQQARMAVKNAKTPQEYEAASDRAGRIKDLLASKGVDVGSVLDKDMKDDIFQIGDEFGISLSEDFEIGTEIVDILEDGIVIELDDRSIKYLAQQGLTFSNIDLSEAKKKGVDGKACWKGYRYAGREKKADGSYKDKCVEIGEDSDVEESGLQYYTGKKKYGKEGMAALAAAGRKGASEEELGRIKDRYKKEDHEVDEAEYQGREVPLGKPMKGDVKKSKVYVKNDKGNVVKVNFGDKKMRIKKSNPSRRKSFRARHNCQNPGPRWKARYWSCRAW